MDEDWATVPMIRVFKFIRDAQDRIYNYRNIGTFIGVSTGTAHAAIKKLLAEGYLINDGGFITYQGASVQKTERKVQDPEHSVQNSERTNISKRKTYVQNTERTNEPPAVKIDEEKFRKQLSMFGLKPREIKAA